MQTAMQLTAAPLSRQQRPLTSKIVTPAGLAPLARRTAVRRPVAARAHLEDALGGMIDSAPSVLDNLAAHLSTRLFLLGDAAEQLAAAADGAAPAAEEAANAAKNSGVFGAFAGAFESFLKVLDEGLEKVGVPYSYGFAIILLTVLVKVATYPLTKQQVESTLSMQALQPKVKELQAKYANDPERLQVETAKMYQTAGVNPLAGCLPSLATIPVFIGLYRALSNVADEGLLSDGFFWIPSLAGPTTVNGGLGWLFSWENGAPPLGWQQTGAYLVLPILLIVSQYISQKVISPPQQSQDPSQQSAQAILKFLPIMIGYFSLNVPSGLTLYWFTNNLITTAQQLYLRRKFMPATAGATVTGNASTAIIDVEPVEKKPSGKELNARRSPKQQESSPAPGSSSGSSRGEKFRAIKAREAAAKAAAQAKAAAPEAGEKSQELKKEKEPAAKAAPQASSTNGAAAPAAAEAAQAEPASSAVAVVEAEVVPEVVAEAEAPAAPAEAPAAPEQEQQQQHEQAPAPGRASSGTASPRGKGGKKKGGKRK